MTGTSQATAFVTGAAALVLASNPVPLEPERVIARVIGSARLNPDLTGKIRSGGVLSTPDVTKVQGRDRSTRNLGQIDRRLFLIGD